MLKGLKEQRYKPTTTGINKAKPEQTVQQYLDWFQEKYYWRVFGPVTLPTDPNGPTKPIDLGHDGFGPD